MRVWITKYALTQGVLELDAEIVYGEYADGKTSDGRRFFTRDFEHTREDALKHAEQMRKARITSLKKAISKLEKLVIRCVEG